MSLGEEGRGSWVARPERKRRAWQLVARPERKRRAWQLGGTPLKKPLLSRVFLVIFLRTLSGET